MEGLQNFSFCPWMSKEVIDVDQYFKSYHELLDKLNTNYPHNLKCPVERFILGSFSVPDDIDRSHSRPGSRLCRMRSSSMDQDQANPTLQKLKQEPNTPQHDSFQEDFFSLERMNERTSISKLTVENELEPRELPVSIQHSNIGRVSNWFAGTFMDGVIPCNAPNLSTLSCQAKELYKRETVKDYVRLRNRLCKYSTTVRTIIRDEESDQNGSSVTMAAATSRNVVFNVRIQRPYHKRTFHRKGWNRFPKYSEEYLVLGSQPLRALRDVITCLNDHYRHKDMSENPDEIKEKKIPTMQQLYPSGFFYFNGVFYVDKSRPFSKDISEEIRVWASSVPNYNEVSVDDMSRVCFKDLKIRLGYPYVYQHLGNCEHLVTFTDVRLHHRSDIQDESRYPLLRGHPISISMKCIICNLFLARWVVKDSETLPDPNSHFCDDCLKQLLYDENGRKIGQFKLYPFIDEILAKKLKAENKELERPLPEGVTVSLKNPSPEPMPRPAKRTKKEPRYTQVKIS